MSRGQYRFAPGGRRQADINKHRSRHAEQDTESPFGNRVLARSTNACQLASDVRLSQQLVHKFIFEFRVIVRTQDFGTDRSTDSP